MYQSTSWPGSSLSALVIHLVHTPYLAVDGQRSPVFVSPNFLLSEFKMSEIILTNKQTIKQNRKARKFKSYTTWD